MEPHVRRSGPRSCLQDWADEGSDYHSLHCEGNVRRGNLSTPGMNLTYYELIHSKSIREQQSKKRNLAEHAFALAKRQDDWLEVSFRAM